MRASAARWLAWAAAPLLACGLAPGGSHPDVLLIVVDTLRADHLGAYGHPGGITPNIDALAAQGLVFERAIAASTRTAPSHASMMTSLRVREHSIGSVNGATRLTDERTLASLLHDAGYATAAFVSNWVITRRSGLDAGFDVYDDEMTQRESNRVDYFSRSAPETTERALQWLAEEHDGPTFLWVHFMEPHGPYEPPPEYTERFAAPPPPDEEPLPVLHTQHGWRGIPAYQVLPGLRRPSAYRARYAGEVAWVDLWVGRVLQAAEQASARRGRELVVLFTADHGEALGEEDYYFVHGDVTWPSVSRVPLILRAPGIEPGRRRGLVHHVDVLPTLVQLAGLEPPPGARGIALGELARRGEPVPERTLFSDIGTEVGVFRGDRYLRVERSAATGGKIRWSGYTWHAGHGWKHSGRRDPELRRQVLDYVSEGRRLEAASTLEPDEIERLRALGYAE